MTREIAKVIVAALDRGEYWPVILGGALVFLIVDIALFVSAVA